MRLTRVIKNILLSGLLLTAACHTPVTDTTSPIVSVSIAPQKYFVERLMDTLVTVNVMIPPGSSHATYSPSPNQLVKLSQSLAYLKIGHISFEQSWEPRLKAANKKMVWYDLSNNIQIIGDNHGHHHHEHGPACSHGVDPHTWTSPREALTIAENTRNALLELFPEHQKTIERNYKHLTSDLISLDERLTELSHEKPGLSFMIFHPAYTYLARAYGFHQIAIEFEGKTPSPARMQSTLQTARHKHITTIYIQQEFDRNVAETIARSVNAKTVQVNPLSEDWLQEMERFITHLEQT